MTMTCTVCRHREQEQIDRALAEGMPLRSIAAQFDTSTASLRRHKFNCLTEAITEVKKARDSEHAESLLL